MLTEPLPAPNPAVLVLDEEYVELADLVCGSPQATPGIALLWQELQRATLVAAGRAPDDVVRMGSRVHLTDFARREERMARLVYPDEAVAPMLLPVTSATGAALLGLREGALFTWTGPDDRTRIIRVDKVEPPTRPRIGRSRRRSA